MNSAMILISQLIGVNGVGILLGIALSYFSIPAAIVVGALFIILAWVSTYLSNKKLRDVFSHISARFQKGLKQIEKVNAK